MKPEFDCDHLKLLSILLLFKFNFAHIAIFLKFKCTV
jgi:hypothetical protein